MPLSDPPQTVAFISNEKELRHLTSNQMTQLCGSIHFVCLTPMAEYHASKAGISHSSIEDLHDTAELMKTLSETWGDCENFAKYLDSEIDARFGDICKHGFFSSIRFMHLLKTFRDTAISKLHILIAALESLSPRKVICFADNSVSYGYEESYLTGDIILKLLESLENRFEYELVCYRINTARKSTPPQIDFARTIERARKLTQLTFRQISTATHRDPHHDFGMPVVAIGESNTLADVDEYIKGWKLSGGKVVNIANVEKRRAFLPASIDTNPFLKGFGLTTTNIDDFSQSLFAKPEFIKWFEYKGIDFSPLVNPWLRQYLRNTVPNCILTVDTFEKILIENKVMALLTSAIASKNQIAAALACKRLGVIIYSVQHGGAGCFSFPVLEYQDYRDIDYSFVHGEGVKQIVQKTFKNDSRDNIAKPVLVGNPHLNRLYEQQRTKSQKYHKKRRILYVLTHLVNDFYYYGWNHYPNIWYSHLQRKVLNVLSDFPEIEVYVKQYPATPIDDPLQTYVRDEYLSNITFLPNYVDMERYLNKMDLFLLDFPGTSLPKMLCTKKPIIVYYNPDFLHVSPDAREMLQKRADVHSTEDALLSSIEKVCRLNTWPEIENPDDIFLKLYSLGKQGTDPTNLVVEHLKSTLA